MGEVRRITAEIQREIERVRADLASKAGVIEERVRALDWRREIRRRPALSVGAAFAIGFVLGLI